MLKKAAILGMCLLGSMSVFALSGQAASGLPNGASSLAESYHDWRLTCQSGNNMAGNNAGPQCLVSQQVFNSQPRQLLVAMRLQPDGMQTRGELTLPFGLDISKGIALLTDGQSVGDIYPFNTCLPVGCIVSLEFDQNQLNTLEKSKTIEVTISFLTGKVMRLPLSPKGLTEAMKRVSSLTRGH